MNVVDTDVTAKSDMIYYTIIANEHSAGLATFSCSPALFEILGVVSNLGMLSEASDVFSDAFDRMSIRYD